MSDDQVEWFRGASPVTSLSRAVDACRTVCYSSDCMQENSLMVNKVADGHTSFRARGLREATMYWVDVKGA